MEPEGKQLVEAAQRGDRAAAVALIEMFYARIYAFLRRLAPSEEDAADLNQKTFSEAWRALPGFAGRSSVSSWLHGIAYHIYIDWRRAQRPTEYRPDEWWHSQPSFAQRPDELAATSDLRSVLYKSVETLDEELRLTVHLHYFEGLTLEETAETMKVATSTVKYRVRQAITALQARLSPANGPKPVFS